MWLADWNISTQLMLSSKFSLRYQSRGRSRAAATSKMELFVIIVTGWKPLTIITKRSILDAAATLDPPLLFLKYILRSSCFRSQWFYRMRQTLIFIFANYFSFKKSFASIEFDETSSRSLHFLCFIINLQKWLMD